MKRAIVFIFACLLSLPVWAEMSLPKNLSDSDQRRALEILGFGSASKILGNPFPLGGYSGVEVGFSTEFISMEDMARLGSKTTDSGEFNYYTLTFGKGFYYNIDALLYFTPAIQSQDIQNFGGQIRWGFYEVGFFPMAFSLVGYGGGANFSNLVNITTMGADLIATVALENVALYFGTGRIRAHGTFIGGANGITADQVTRTQYADETHSLFGVNINVAKVFVALEIDRYVDSVYSGKLGLRF